MKRRTEPPRTRLATPGIEKMPETSSRQRKLSLLATLEQCRESLIDEAGAEAARLLSMAILALRMEIHQVTDSELKALCDLMAPAGQPRHDAMVAHGQWLPPYLKLIK